MSNVKVSIITVVYNAVNTIERTIQSVMSQDYANIEYIVVDGGSTDGTSELVEKYKDAIDISIREPDEGIYDAMNKGIRQASGEIIALLNADDWYCHSGVISLVVKSFEECGEAVGIISGQVNNVRGDLIENISCCNAFEEIWSNMPIAHPATFVRRKVYEEIGEFDTSFRIAADYDFIFRCYLQKISLFYIREILVNFSVEGISCTQKQKCWEEDIRILKKYAKACDTPEKVEEAILRREKQIAFYKCSAEQLDGVIKLPVYIWGCGVWGKEMESELTRKGFASNGFIDNNAKVWGKEILGKKVYAPAILQSGSANVLIAVKGKEEEIKAQIAELNPDISVMGMRELFEKIWLLTKVAERDVSAT